MNNIFRVPVDNQHFRDTIEIGKPVSEIQGYFSPNEGAKVHNIAKDGFVRFWGSIPGEANKGYFSRFLENDDLLCYRGGKYIAHAKIAFTSINRKLAESVWGITETGKTWELIYFLKDITFIDVDALVVNKEFGMNSRTVMNFGAISNDRVINFIATHSSLHEFLMKFGNTKDKQIEQMISTKLQTINNRFEAQYYLAELGNLLEYNTYVPPSDAGHMAFDKKLDEVITVRKDDLVDFVAPRILDPLSNIDVIWFTGNYIPRYFFEVIHVTGMEEAFARLDTVSKHYETSGIKVVCPPNVIKEFETTRRLYFPHTSKLKYKTYDELVETHANTIKNKSLIQAFLT